MWDLLALVRAISDANRVRLLMALRGGELCVCQLIEFISLAPSTVSKHMSILRTVNLVESRKKGRWVYYRLSDSLSNKPVKDLFSWLETTLDNDPTIRADEEKLELVLKKMPTEVCRE